MRTDLDRYKTERPDGDLEPRLSRSAALLPCLRPMPWFFEAFVKRLELEEKEEEEEVEEEDEVEAESEVAAEPDVAAEPEMAAEPELALEWFQRPTSE